MSVFASDPLYVNADLRSLESHRVIAWTKDHPATRAFDILRTKVLAMMRTQRWTTLGITSPREDCGKTTVAINLAFSLTHQLRSKIMLVDLDLRQPQIASMLGIQEATDLGYRLQENVPVPFCVLRAGTTELQLVPNQKGRKHATELLGLPRVQQMLDEFRPDSQRSLGVFDLPPLLTTDDAVAVLPKLDCALLIIGADVTKRDEIAEALRLMGGTSVLGVVLNRSREKIDAYY